MNWAKLKIPDDPVVDRPRAAFSIAERIVDVINEGKGDGRSVLEVINGLVGLRLWVDGEKEISPTM